ncbi:hypothetical protein PTSG_06960 [Salpingoeca rosetta]|uniref:Sulfatase N-terminal domain-containing protein n=1 Tax=Salpingoeca rosetta (strain ATCC 50818 / BSB-021) TaxID=946362 RepID=F2UFB0_SALR5|nr:uncharacterized protein PTSG_06960 [Salpingoeca rosetta]EGD75310.1 hypothetical protein PTSG_06960 [Salpingoeca rosetta]|eukprot:XP_004992363.1 hypothetical protein PTSG_06960 [Salpingoeca rosetta]
MLLVVLGGNKGNSGLRLPAAAAAAAEGDRPNVIVFLLDDVGAARFPFYGSETDVTPNINSLADKAVVFDSFFTQPVCGPSRATLLSGRYPSSTGVIENNSDADTFADADCTLGSTFQSVGYSTAVFGKLHAAHTHVNTLNSSCGFDKWSIWAREGARYHNAFITTNLGHGGNLTYDEMVEAATSVNGTAESRTFQIQDAYCPHLNRELAKAHITASKAEGRPFFMYLPMLLAHGRFPERDSEPSLPPGMIPASDPPYSNLFDQRVMVADAIIGDILRHLTIEGVAKNTIVVVVGDNGAPRKVEAVVNGVTVESGKFTAYRSAGTRVPCLFYDPRIPVAIPKARRIRAVANMYDILPTLMDATNIDRLPAGKNKPNGASLWKFITNDRRGWGKWTFLFGQQPAHAVIRNHKVIISSLGDIYSENKWYTPKPLAPTAVCTKKLVRKRYQYMVNHAWKAGINVTLPGSDTPLAPYSCDDLVCNPDTNLLECITTN